MRFWNFRVNVAMAKIWFVFCASLVRVHQYWQTANVILLVRCCARYCDSILVITSRQVLAEANEWRKKKGNTCESL